MLRSETLKFLQQLEKNNNKPWFDEHKKDYLAAKEDMEAMMGRLMEKMSSIEPSLKDQKAKDTIHRIYRDVRFSKDKSPYKSNFGAVLGKGGKKIVGAGYYLHIQPGHSFAGGGIWMPEGPTLKKIRQEIDYSFKEFNGILNKASFKKFFPKIDGDKLKSLPQGYTADNPAIEYLKMKSFTVGHAFSDKDVTGKDFDKKVVEVFKAMSAFVDFLNRSVD